MNLFLIAQELQDRINEEMKDNADAIYKLAEAQKLVEEAYALLSKGEGAVPLDYDHFLETGERIAKWPNTGDQNISAVS